MAHTFCFTPICTLKSSNGPGIMTSNSVARKAFQIIDGCQNSKLRSLEVKATENNQSTKPKTLVCSKCDGNGAILCSQCNGSGVNSKDHFNGQFKAGGLCWLCRGKKEILCGDCNGAGFVGGFMNSFED